MQLEAGENLRARRFAKVLERRGSVGTLGNGNAVFRQNGGGRALQMVGEGLEEQKPGSLKEVIPTPRLIKAGYWVLLLKVECSCRFS